MLNDVGMDRMTAWRWQVMSYVPEPELVPSAAWARS